MREGMVHPAFVWVPSIGTSGLMVYTGDKFPRWQGDLFAGGLSGEKVSRLIVEDGEIVEQATLLRGIGRVRDVRQGPDGYIYVAIENRDGSPTPIVRLEPVDES
jgi:glucose/arabinose dehydrogenase